MMCPLVPVLSIFFLFLIRKKFTDIDLSSMDFSSMESHDVPFWDDYVD